MIKYIVFDLSEVIINGVIGIEKVLCSRLPLTEKQVIDCFSGKVFEELMLGNVDEDSYIKNILEKEKWGVTAPELKQIIRDNLKGEVEGVIPLVRKLSENYTLYLLSDNSREWVEHIKEVHPFLAVFKEVFFSYELKMTKKNPAVFTHLLQRLNLDPAEVLFVDDHKRNIDNAKLAGIDGIVFRNAEQLKSDLELRGIKTAESF
ncbi:MAG: HAD-IA family hydrolase [Syntrophothermus sp.]